MNQPDYNEISNVYDDVREADLRLLEHLLRRLPPHEAARILDIGCGTDNYTDSLIFVEQKVLFQGEEVDLGRISWNLCERRGIPRWAFCQMRNT